ncbi:endonuclease domain-containing 1 protein-like [Pholidichthys leucotaenia]
MQNSVTAFILLLFLLPVGSHVVNDFTNCKQFFYNQCVPQWTTSNNYRHICQTIENQPRFATLYDTANRIPVYSAYMVENQMSDGGGRTDEWFVEPQLVNLNYENSMKTAKSLMDSSDGLTIAQVGQNQAVEEDYAALTVLINNIRYNRGHLNPSGHHTGDSSKATNTLTNIVPQNLALNEGQWLTAEKNRNDPASRGLATYVLVGAIPSSNNWVTRNGVNRVNIPDYIWAAHCYKNTGGRKAKFPICHAVIARNNENRVYNLGNQNDLNALNNLLTQNHQNPLSGQDAPSRLEDFLKRHYTGIRLFDTECYKPGESGGGGSGLSGSGGSNRS